MSESLGFFTHFYGRLLAPTWRYYFDERGDTAKAQWPPALVPRPDTLTWGEEALKKVMMWRRHGHMPFLHGYPVFEHGYQWVRKYGGVFFNSWDGSSFDSP